MAEAFKQGMYMFVSGIMFCIAVASVAFMVIGIGNMNRSIHSEQGVVYDINIDYYAGDH